MSPAPYGVSTDVWVHDQVNRVEKALSALAGTPMRIEEVERLAIALAKAQAMVVVRARRWADDAEHDELRMNGDAELDPYDGS